MAVGHSILVIAYEMLKHRTTYNDLGTNYFDERDRQPRSGGWCVTWSDWATKFPLSRFLQLPDPRLFSEQTLAVCLSELDGRPAGIEGFLARGDIYSGGLL